VLSVVLEASEALTESATAFSSVVSAVCAPEMLLLESALETLEINSPSGLLELTPDGMNFSTWVRYC
jgi:hypothetical protein